MSDLSKNPLFDLAKHNQNVLLVGSHGIGKTTIVFAVLDALGIPYVYRSAATMDPWVDLVGVPAPNKETGNLEFYRPSEILDCEVLVIDELNRAHPRVMNAILEMVQFKTINGAPLKKLRMVWAMTNPDDYDSATDTLPAPLMDRFHHRLECKAEPDPKWLSENANCTFAVAKAVVDWWNEDLAKPQQFHISPRRLESICFAIGHGLKWRNAAFSTDPKQEVPYARLESRLKLIVASPEVSKAAVLGRAQEVLKGLRERDPNVTQTVIEVLKNQTNSNALVARWDLVEMLPAEHKQAFFIAVKEKLGKYFREKASDPQAIVDSLNEIYPGTGRTKYDELKKIFL